MSDANPDPDPKKERPPFSLDYYHVPEPFSIPALIGGVLLGLFGTEAVAFIAAFFFFNLEGSGKTPGQIVLMVIEFAIGGIAAITLLSSIFRDRPRRGAFLIGFLTGLCAIALLNGVCWYSGG